LPKKKEKKVGEEEQGKEGNSDVGGRAQAREQGLTLPLSK
jgi:hypothetical protein